MYMTDKKLVSDYRKGNPHERFCLIYKNYSVFLQAVESFERSVFHTILCEKEYNHRNHDDLGVRVQTSNQSNPTEKMAIEHVMIMDAMKNCDFSGDLLKGTDDENGHRLDILTIRMMRNEYELFDSNLKALPGKQFGITYKYIHKDCGLEKIAETEELAPQTVRNVLHITRKNLEDNIVPYLTDAI